MSDSGLELIVRTPLALLLRERVLAIRVPCETGQVGIRPRTEPTVLAVEGGIITVRRHQSELFIGTAGGLLTCDGHSVVLLTPLAVMGENEQQLTQDLQSQLMEPTAEIAARTTLSKLENRILNEMRERRKADLCAGALNP